MVSSAPASSDPRPLRAAQRPVRAGADEHPHAIVRFLALPAAFFAANWAALLMVPTVVGTVPALVATTRTTTDLSEHGDRAFRETLTASGRLLRRDGPASLVLWAVIALLAGDVAILTLLVEGGTRVLLVGMALPPLWVAISVLSAYVVAAASAGIGAGRPEVVRAAVALVLRRPGRALLAPAMIVALAPLWLLAPLTIAVGVSLPPHVLARFWAPSKGCPA